jgi:hypothetical protein
MIINLASLNDEVSPAKSRNSIDKNILADANNEIHIVDEELKHNN